MIARITSYAARSIEMTPTIVAELPNFDSGLYDKSEFSMRGGTAVLSVFVGGLNPFHFHFEKVRWHQFTALYNCAPEMIRDAYFRLVEIAASEALERYVCEDRAPLKAYKRLRHFRIFLDEDGCHEVFAESALMIS